MSFKVRLSRRFVRESKQFFRKHPELESVYERVVEDLRSDPFQPRLRLHALKGEFDGLHAISLTYSYRITLTLLVTEQEVILLHIGTHDEVYRR
ncbi:MAG: type II toxin-antitoxin system RelE/ParE family toxin [Thermomicrobiales bacterium]